MKKIFLLILLLFTSCGKQDDNVYEKEKIASRNAEAKVKSEIIEFEAVTQILDTGKNRVSNIREACESVNGKILIPGEEFSFNEATGPRTKKNGYKYAPVIVSGEKSYGIGGGVCQVSTTIYMAALKAGLSVTEHYNHSERVAYAPEGNDATVVYGVKDLKIKNTSGGVITIFAEIKDNSVIVKLEAEASSETK